MQIVKKLRKVLLYILQGTAGTTTKQKLLSRNIYKLHAISYCFLLFPAKKTILFCSHGNVAAKRTILSHERGARSVACKWPVMSRTIILFFCKQWLAKCFKHLF